MKDFLKKNFALLIAFTLPVLLIVVVALSIYLPAFFLSTDYNFVYSTCTDPGSRYNSQCNDYLNKKYSVDNDKLVVNKVTDEQDLNFTGRLFLHDTEKNESREITLDEAKSLKLNSLLTSPDGVSVSYSYDRGADFIFLSSGSTRGYYLIKGKSKKKINLINQNERYYYRDNFHFIGWVLDGKN